MLTPLDALIDAIIHCSGYNTPGSPSYLARNPGGLKVHAVGVPATEQPYRAFKSIVDGLQALRFDVRCKSRRCTTLLELVLAYDKKPMEAKAWVGFLKRALNDDSINPATPLTFFTEQK